MPSSFLLDPGYAGTLESGEFRRRIASLAAMPGNIPGYGCYALLILFVNIIPLVLYFILGDPEYLIGAGAWAMIAVPLAGFFAWVWSKGFRYLLRQRRLARQGVLVQGIVLTARRARQTIPGSDFSESEDSY